jgi:hypothetical protein
MVLLWTQLWRPAEPPRFTRLSLPSENVVSARFSADGSAALYTSVLPDRSVRSWSILFSQRFRRPLEAAGGRDLRVAAVSSDGELALIGAPPGHPLRGLTGTSFIFGLSHPSNFAMLSLVGKAGGAPREILAQVGDADFLPGGGLLILRLADATPAPRRPEVVLEAPGGKALVSSRGILNPRVDPSGRMVAYGEQPRADDSRGVVQIVDRNGARLASTEEHRVLHGVAWSPRGAEVWFGTNSGIRALALNGRERSVLTGPWCCGLHDVDRQGRALVTSEILETRWACSQRGQGPIDCSGPSPHAYVKGLSADGRLAVLWVQGLISIEGEPSEYSTWVQPTDGSAPTRLGPYEPLAITEDGQWVAVKTFPRDGRFAILLYPVSAGPPRNLLEVQLSETGRLYGAFSPQGDRLLLLHGKERYEIALGAPTLRKLEIPADVECDQYSRDGRALLCGPLPENAAEGGPLVRYDPETRARLVIQPPRGLGGPARPAAGSYATVRTPRVGELRDGALVWAVKNSDGADEIWILRPGKAPELRHRSTAHALGWDRIGGLLSADGSVVVDGFHRVAFTLYLVEGLR